MADNLTNAGESLAINAIFGLAALDNTANTYIALLTADPTEAGLLTNELPNSGGYARATVASAFGTASSNGSNLDNDTEISFSFTADVGTVAYLAIVTGATIGAGTVLWYVPLDTPRATGAGVTITVPVGALSNSIA